MVSSSVSTSTVARRSGRFVIFSPSAPPALRTTTSWLGPAPGRWTCRNRAGSSPATVSVYVTAGGTNTQVCLSTRCSSRSNRNASWPSRTRNASASPGRSLSRRILSLGAARTSSALNCSRSTRDVRPRTELQPSARVRRAPLPLCILVSRRRVAAGGACRAGCGARVRSARAHGSRRRVRLARVRARGEVVRRAADHGRGSHPRPRCSPHAPRREQARVREPLPPPHRSACGNAPGRERGPRAAAAVVSLEVVAELNDGLVCLSGCARRGLALLDPNAAARLAHAFGRERFYVELQRPFERGDARLRDLAEHLGVETVATGDVHAHHPRRTLLQDVLVAIRCRTSLEGCEPERRGNRESYLRSPEEMLERFSFDRHAAERSVRVAERLEFDLTEELGYRYPDFSDGAESAIRQLAAICHAAVAERYGPRDTVSQEEARARLESELALIDELGL